MSKTEREREIICILVRLVSHVHFPVSFFCLKINIHNTSSQHGVCVCVLLLVCALFVWVYMSAPLSLSMSQSKKEREIMKVCVRLRD